MAKTKLFHRSKTKETLLPIKTTIQKQFREPKNTEEHERKPIKEYYETLYTNGSAQKTITTPSRERQPIQRYSWENAETIEQNVDNMTNTQTESAPYQPQKGVDTEKKVDYILLKKKK